MKKLILSSILAFSFATPALAEVQTTDITEMPAGLYQLDASHATVLFKVRHMGFADYIGRFDKLAGEIDLNTDKVEESHVSITIETNSIDTNNEKLEKELKSANAFDAEKYPNITFEATDLEMQTETTGLMTGDLTMMGETHQVTFDVVFNGGGVHPMNSKNTMGFSATTTLDRTDWGLDNWVPMVSADVQIEVHAEFNGAVTDRPFAK
ncbi:MAG: polyisoprenoid-binding protein [Magnetococcales bacterium]|jgi:polyisoprenoid-binding protein YceI|nr:polyisoprenoid-binding protein [Magnetococcales bacterium]|tara:strand:+ start:173713 stop:174339 length:627 start_codon:yes stop_codon:yes gene_type:complete